MNQDLQALILAEEAKYVEPGSEQHRRLALATRLPRPSGAGRGGVDHWVTWAVNQMVDATAGAGAFKGTLSASAWATICRAGAYHAPHSHPDSAWSGVYYVDAGTRHPDRPLSGVLEFLDPRAGVEAVTAPGDPYGEPVRVRPEAGLLVIFPSWLYHWVHPYAGRHAPHRGLVQHDVQGTDPTLTSLHAVRSVLTRHDGARSLTALRESPRSCI